MAFFCATLTLYEARVSGVIGERLLAKANANHFSSRMSSVPTSYFTFTRNIHRCGKIANIFVSKDSVMT